MRRFVGTDQIGLQITHVNAANNLVLLHSQAILLNINHVVSQLIEIVGTNEEMLRSINHRSLLIEALATRMETLDNVHHHLRDLDSAAISAAERASVDAESVAVMAKLIEKLLNDLNQEISSLTDHAMNSTTDSATSR
jgi:hypothetical protein